MYINLRYIKVAKTGEVVPKRGGIMVNPQILVLSGHQNLTYDHYQWLSYCLQLF